MGERNILIDCRYQPVLIAEYLLEYSKIVVNHNTVVGHKQTLWLHVLFYFQHSVVVKLLYNKLLQL